jgi:hypothetical protein
MYSKTGGPFGTTILDLGHTYIALLLFQVIYQNEEQTIHSYEPRGKRTQYQKWLKTIKDYVKTKLTNIGNSNKQWNLNQASRLRIQKKKRIATCMQMPNKRRGINSLMAFAAVAMQASEGSNDNSVTFDTDSAPVGVDNCISNQIEDFEGPLLESNRSIKRFGGSRTNKVMIGTISWKWQDDEGMIHKFLIPKSFYV